MQTVDECVLRLLQTRLLTSDECTGTIRDGNRRMSERYVARPPRALRCRGGRSGVHFILGRYRTERRSVPSRAEANRPRSSTHSYCTGAETVLQKGRGGRDPTPITEPCHVKNDSNHPCCKEIYLTETYVEAADVAVGIQSLLLGRKEQTWLPPQSSSWT